MGSSKDDHNDSGSGHGVSHPSNELEAIRLLALLGGAQNTVVDLFLQPPKEAMTL